jgi:hypothetical protein
MLELASQLDFTLEPLCGQAGRYFAREHLHNDLASEPDLFGNKNTRHSAAAQLALEVVGIA